MSNQSAREDIDNGAGVENAEILGCFGEADVGTRADFIDDVSRDEAI